jgi:hypothetical protein
MGAAAVNAPASTASANKDAFRAEYGGQETIVMAHCGIIFRRAATGEYVMQITAIRGGSAIRL